MDELESIQEDFCEYVRNFIDEETLFKVRTRLMDLVQKGVESDVAVDIAWAEILYMISAKNLADTLGAAGMFIVEIPLEKEIKEAHKIKVPPRNEQH